MESRTWNVSYPCHPCSRMLSLERGTCFPETLRKTGGFEEENRVDESGERPKNVAGEKRGRGKVHSPVQTCQPTFGPKSTSIPEVLESTSIFCLKMDQDFVLRINRPDFRPDVPSCLPFVLRINGSDFRSLRSLD